MRRGAGGGGRGRRDGGTRQRGVDADVRVHRAGVRGGGPEGAHRMPRQRRGAVQSARHRGEAAGRVRGGEAHGVPKRRQRVRREAEGQPAVLREDEPAELPRGDDAVQVEAQLGRRPRRK